MDILKIIKIRHNINIVIFTTMLLSVFALFYMQFKFQNLEEKLLNINSEISYYENNLNLLDAEMTYLSRPERLVRLSKKYLQGNNYIATNQVKKYEALQKHYLAKLEKYHKNRVALNN